MKVWSHIALEVWRKEHSLTTPSEAHCELRKSTGTLNCESQKEGMFVDNTFRGTLWIIKVWKHIAPKVWRKEHLLTTSEGRNIYWQHPQMHIGNYESLKAHWIMKVWRHIALKVWRMERSLTTPSEARCELRKSEGTLNYESLKAHCSESLKEWTFVENTCRDTLRITKSEGTLNYESLKEGMFVDNTFRGTLWITKVWRHIELWKSEGTSLWKSERRNARWQHLKRHIELWKSEGTLLW
jgi:hypothetical protein